MVQARILFTLYTLTFLVLGILYVKFVYDEWMSDGGRSVFAPMFGLLTVIISVTVYATRRVSRWRCSETYYRLVYVVLIMLLFLMSFMCSLVENYFFIIVTFMFCVSGVLLVSALYGKTFDAFLFFAQLMVVVVGIVVGTYETNVIGMDLMKETLSQLV